MMNYEIHFDSYVYIDVLWTRGRQLLIPYITHTQTFRQLWINRIYHHFVQGQGNPSECQRFAVHDEAC